MVIWYYTIRKDIPMRKYISYIFNTAIVILVATAAISCTQENPHRSTVTKEEHYTTKEGIPCIIFRGGSHSNIIGISCDYTAERTKHSSNWKNLWK
jgi:hypothetical protein